MTADTGRVTPRPAAAAVGLSVCLGLVVPIMIVGTATAPSSAAWVVQAACAAISGTALAGVLSAPTLQPMHLAFWTFSYVWLGAAPLGMLTRDEYPWGLRVTSEVSFQASGLVLVGMLAFLAGSLLCAGHLRGRAETAGDGAETVGAATPIAPGELSRPLVRGTLAALVGRRLSWRRTVLLTALCLALAVVLVPRLGGLGSFFQSRQASNAATEAASGGGDGRAGAALIGWGLSVPAFWALFALLRVPVPSGFGPRVGRRVLLFVAVVLNVVVNNPISQPRFWAGTVLLALAFGSRLLTSVGWFRVFGMLLLAGLVLVFPMADYFRYEVHPRLDPVGVTTQLFTNPDYDAYQQIQGGVAMVADTGYTPSAALAAPLFWVPRSAWPGKPYDTGTVIGRFVGYDFLNLSAPLWIEAYVAAGLLGVVLVFVGLGAFCRRADHAFHRHRFERWHLAGVLVPPMAFYLIIVLRGSLLQSMAALSLIVVVPFLITTPIRPAPEQAPGPVPRVMPTPCAAASPAASAEVATPVPAPRQEPGSARSARPYSPKGSS